jgi:pimeloyl-ACP methyl ester carboxylesterase
MEKTGSVKWHQKINGSKCVKILAANHIANQDNSEDFNKALLDFLNTNNAVNTNGLNKS